MKDFPEECEGCPFATGDFVMTSEYLAEFKCQCGCEANCSYLDRAREFIEDCE